VTPNKLALLFGDNPPADVDLNDPDQLRKAIEESAPPDQTIRQVTLLGMVPDQIVSVDPPDVWETAQRLLALGMDRESVLQELVVALGPVAVAASKVADAELGPVPDSKRACGSCHYLTPIRSGASSAPRSKTGLR
jgi:hypothetical protein